MVTHNLLFDTMIYMYALSLLFYFSDFVDASRRAKRMGTGLLIFVWTLQTGYLLMRMVHHADFALLSRLEYMLFFSWLLVTVSLVASRFFRIDLLVFFVNVIAFVLLTVNLFSNASEEMPLATWQLARELLYVHISLVLCAYAAFTFAAIFSGMYLFLHFQLKTKNWSKTMRRLPSLESMELYTFRSVVIGVPLMIMSLAFAVASLLFEGRMAFLLDWKVISSFIALFFYISYVVKRTLFNQPGWRTTRWNLLSYAVLILNLLLSSFSRFHSFS
ncbi:cytochrome C assembly protein [Paenibacillus sambharensis]|uniref:Cytochrome C assembly protein n=1 Tax=Paenibacillus sambharensis TaxID=1803190 RepID=A0A2W1LGG6_9BACL|nr:cytochrome c biogenesis protein CcsA [Paenibacillus sambharensis]PZD94105.1 cytochrome C assembly protein [Paenibacillus sambharensis]